MAEWIDPRSPDGPGEPMAGVRSSETSAAGEPANSAPSATPGAPATPTPPAPPAPPAAPVRPAWLDEPIAVPASGAPVLQAAEVTYVRANTTILDGVSVDVFGGEVLAVMGPSGSGKSSLLALLAGLERPDSGRVQYAGTALDHIPPAFGIVLQGYGLVNLLTAAENVEVALQARSLPESLVRSRAADALALVGLDHVADHLVEELSGGQQQRVAIARALATDPAVLIADELTAELDSVTKDVIAELVINRAAHGVAVVLATHDPALASRCHRQLYLVDGRVQEQRG